MKDKDAKKVYDKALLELQEATEIVIAGFVGKSMTTVMQADGTAPSSPRTGDRLVGGKRCFANSRRRGRKIIMERLNRTCTEKALKAFKKALQM